MIKNYIKIAVRTLRKEKLYTLIHIMGITLSITACLLIGTVVIDELSYDKQWSRSADTYRLLTIREDAGAFSQKGGTVYAGLAPTLKQNFPEVEEYSNVYPNTISLKINETDELPIKATILLADTAVYKLLDVELIDQEDLMPTGDIPKIILSESFCKTHFGNKNPLGQRIYDMPKYDNESNTYLVAGIMKDIPSNTHLRSDMVMLLNRKEELLTKNRQGPGMQFTKQYIMLRKGTDPQQFEHKINDWYHQFTDIDKKVRFGLQPMADIYLKTDFPAYQPIKGNVQHSYMFSAVAILLLLIACINYVNLSTARASSRIKETGMKKLLGASRRNILTQSLLESLLIFSTAGALAFICYQLAIPKLEYFIGHPLAFRFLAHWTYFAYVMGAFLLICLFSGLYPAWLVSGFRSIGNIQSILREGKNRQGWLRPSLVVLQLSISITVLIAMLVIQYQVQFLKSKDIGFDTEGLLSIDYVSWDNKSTALRTELLKNTAILSTSFTYWLPTVPGMEMKLLRTPGKSYDETELWYIDGEPNMALTMGLTLKEGRFLDTDRLGDAVQADEVSPGSSSLRPCLITASTARLLEIDTLNQPFPEAGIIPVGIVDDFHSESLHKQTVPTVIRAYRDPSAGALLIRTQPGEERNAMSYIASVWKELYPNKHFDIQFVRETLAKQYEAEEKLYHLFRIFSLLTMLLAIMGILGLVVHALRLRVQEIGIRKVLGASVINITTMLSKDFVKLVLLAIIIASPIAWWLMNKWLENFAYRIEIPWWIFVLSGATAFFITLSTVGYRAIKAAKTNPVDSLRDE